MKKLLSVLLIMSCLAGCSYKGAFAKPKKEEPYVYGMWVTCFELENLANKGFKQNFEDLVADAENMGINTLFVHTRAFESSIYNSSLFPLEQWCKKEGYDVLEFMIEIAHKHNIEFHAWVNPYRLSSNTEAVLSNELDFLVESEDYCRTDSGVYLNPASLSAQTLIINGIKEIISKYNVDGIHFDDYFYPTTADSFDSAAYESYCKTSKNPLVLSDFRRAQVNVMIGAVNKAVKSSKRDILFSVSPAADIKRNYNELYADIELWCKNGLVDALIPQLYFGFNHPLEKFCFENLVIEWLNCTGKTSVLLYIGLAPYKIGITDGPDSAEWENGVDVVANQLKNIFAKAEISGAVLFSYSYLSKEGELYTKQKENIKNAILSKKGMTL